ncbi:MAG: TetR/AcrR family transcriptional regulator [Pseudomonadota bacterium]
MKNDQPRRQKRSERTIGYIVEAGLQLLVQRSENSFTTNHIAERAGVSIGTLYRYFDDKFGVAEQVARREIATTITKILHTIRNEPFARPEDLFDAVIAIHMEAFPRRPGLWFGIQRYAWRSPAFQALSKRTRMTAIGALEERLVRDWPERCKTMSETEKLFLSSRWLAAVQTGIAEAPETVDDGRLMAELKTILVVAFLSTETATQKVSL